MYLAIEIIAIAPHVPDIENVHERLEAALGCTNTETNCPMIALSSTGVPTIDAAHAYFAGPDVITPERLRTELPDLLFVFGLANKIEAEALTDVLVDLFTYTVAVQHTDRTRNADGTYRTFTAIVQVLADTDNEATMVACQMTHAIRADLDPMVLGARITDLIE